jgi:hypothetical protein
MPLIQRRFRVVTIPRAEHDAQLAQLRSEIVAEQAIEDASRGSFGSKSAAAAKARAHDKLKKQAEEEAHKVVVSAIAYDEFGPLQDLHPPREGNALDEHVGSNRGTFPHALLKVSLVEPDTAQGDTPEERLADLIAKGDEAFEQLGKPSVTLYRKLESAAWDMNVGDDSLPNYSAASLLQAARGRGSKQPSDSE